MECSKVKYGSKKAADDDIARIQKKSTRDTVPIRSYQCRKCDGSPWHLTSRQDLFKYTEAETKRIAELTDQVNKLRKENDMLRSNAHMEINKEIKIDDRIVVLNETIRTLKKSLLLSKKDNSDLIARIIQLEKQVAGRYSKP